MGNRMAPTQTSNCQGGSTNNAAIINGTRTQAAILFQASRTIRPPPVPGLMRLTWYHKSHGKSENT